MNDTFVKLYRKTLENPVLSSDNNAYIMFTKLLLKVDWNSGQATLGRSQLAQLCNMKPTTAYGVLLRLVDNNFVTASSFTKYTEITVVNWSKYQGSKAPIRQLDEESVTASRLNDDTIIRNKEVRIKNNTNVEFHPKYQPTHEKICLLFAKSPSQYKLSIKRRDTLKRRISDIGEDKVIQACDALSKSSFHMGDNARNWIADPYWCLQSFEKAEEWAGKYESTGYKGDLKDLEI